MLTAVVLLLALLGGTAKVIDGDVTISQVENYHITINGMQVNSSNCGDINVYGKTAGRVTYDEDTHTLVFDDVETETPGAADWFDIVDGSGQGVLTVRFVGSNHIRASVSIEEAEGAYGPLELIIVEGDHPGADYSLKCGTFTANRHLRIKDCQIDASRLCSYDNKPINLEIIHSHIMLSGTAGKPTLGGFGSFKLTDCYVATPEDWWYGQNYKIDRCLNDGTGSCFMAVEIVPEGMAKGDVNSDGTVDVADIATIVNVMAGSASETLKASADVNGDGSVDVADIATIINVMAGK